MALYHNVPLLLLPLHFDQFDIAARIFEKKLGLVLKLAEDPTREFGSVPLSEAFRAYINRLLAMPSSSSQGIPRAVNAASKAFKFYNGLKRACDAVHETIELGGNEHLTPTWYALPTFRIYNLDIMAICFGLPSLIAFVFFCVFGYKYLNSTGYFDKVKKD